MSKSSLFQEAESNPNSALAVQAPVHLETGSGVQKRAKERNAQSLDSIRGVPPCESRQLAELISGSQVGRAYQEEVKSLWLVARIDPRTDRGGDIEKLLSLFEADPSLSANRDLLKQLHSIARANSLFGVSAEEYASKGIDFTQVRREYLVECIRSVIDSDTILQGRQPLCPLTSMQKLATRGYYLEKLTDIALRGSTTLQSGFEVAMNPRYVEVAQQNSVGQLGEVKCAYRSMGMLMVTYMLTSAGDLESNNPIPLVERQAGLYSDQYTLAFQRLFGLEAVCIHRSAKNITIDSESGLLVMDKEAHSAKTESVNLMGYVEHQVQRGRRVFVDTVFNFSSSHSSSNGEHTRHALVAESIEMRNGEKWIRCANPIGDFVDTSKNSFNYSEYFPTGTLLGDRNGFWFETAENGDILVPAYVLERNIQTAIGITGKSYHASMGTSTKFLGERGAETRRMILFYDPTTDMPRLEDQSEAAQIEQVLAELFDSVCDSGIEDDAPRIVDSSSNKREVQRKRYSPEELELERLAQIAAEERDERRHERAGGPTFTSEPSEALVAEPFRIKQPEELTMHPQQGDPVATTEPDTSKTRVVAPAAPTSSTFVLGALFNK